jgi:AcrR family transcriptional regulator
MIYGFPSIDYGDGMPEWIPRPSSAKGRLVLAALEAFGQHGYERVNVVELARTAGVTTGSLYHHFGNKLALYDFVREEAQRRVLDRMEGAAAARADGPPVEAARAALLVAFDYSAGEGLAGLLAEPVPPGGKSDEVAAFLARLTDGTGDARVPISRMLVAAWRAALQAAADGIPVAAARRALAALHVDLPAAA